MSDIIDINVGETIEEVTINVVDNLITVNINKVTGGGGSQTLAETLALGNVTNGENISISNGDAIVLDNGSMLKKGTIDAGNGGAKGISQICGVGYEHKWEAGRLYIMNDGGTIIREVSHNLTYTPTATDDVTKGFVQNTRWILDNGDVYLCTDPTEGAAVWELVNTGTTPTLQEVLDNNHDLVDGNFFAGTAAGLNNLGTEVNALGISAAENNIGNFVNALGNGAANNNEGINVNALGITAAFINTGNNVNALGDSAGLTNTFNHVNLLGNSANADEDGQTVLSKDGAIMARISTTDLTESHKYILPDADGTIAFTSDIPDTSTLVPYQLGGGVSKSINLFDEVGNVGSLKLPDNLTQDRLLLFQDKDYTGIADITDIPDTSTLVPYTGATTDVDLGEFELKAGQVEFDQTPTGTAGVGVMRWNDTDGTLDLGLKGGNVTLQIGQEEVVRVVNKTATNVNLLQANYQAVRITGAQGQRLKVDLAQATNDALSSETIGLVTETINNNQEGFITTNGLVRNINTTGSLQGETWVDGDIVYLSATTAGNITNIKPLAPNHLVIIGYVVSAHITQGTIFVKVDVGYELDELHNVALSTPLNNQALTYETSTQLWKNKTIIEDSITDGVTDKAPSQNSVFDALGLKQATLVSGTNIKTINGASVLGSGDLVVGGSSSLTVGTTPITSGTIGRVFFQGTGNVLQQSASLFWDNTNARLGVGATPATTVRLDVRAQGALSTDIAFRVRNSADTANLATVQGNGNVGIGTDAPLETLHVNGSILSRTSNPLFIMRDTDLDNNALYLGADFGFNPSVSYGTFSINRNPANGVFFSTAKASAQINLESRSNNSEIAFYTSAANNTTPTQQLRLHSNGNLIIQNGGTFTDAGFRLDVNGTQRVQGKLSVNTPTQASAVMEVTSTTQGFLPPRMTTTQKNAIATPAAGLVVYDTTLNKLCVYTTAWETITSL